MEWRFVKYRPDETTRDPFGRVAEKSPASSRGRGSP